MSDDKHTPEPWKVGKFGHSITPSNGRGSICRFEGLRNMLQRYEANAKRIVNCVNACAGIDNPPEAIRKLVEVVPEPDLLESYAGLIKPDIEKSGDRGDQIYDLWVFLKTQAKLAREALAMVNKSNGS